MDLRGLCGQKASVYGDLSRCRNIDIGDPPEHDVRPETLPQKLAVVGKEFHDPCPDGSETDQPCRYGFFHVKPPAALKSYMEFPSIASFGNGGSGGFS
jgi:hypothetical protein